MKKEVIIVPKDKCPLDVLAEMGEQTKSSWIYLHKTAFDKLMSENCSKKDEMTFCELTFEETDDYPKTTILINDTGGGVWFTVCSISANDIAFKGRAMDPENIFFLKMEE